jgi:MFS family permease
VGVGEAVLAPTALSMLGDSVAASRLGFASGVFYAGIPVGFAASFALAGWISPWLGWRACFLVLGILGLLALPLVLRMEDPARRGAVAVAPPPLAVQARALARALRERPAILAVSLAGGAFAFASAASQHTITWLVDERGLPYVRAAFLSAAVLAPAGILGNVLLGTLTDRWRAPRPGGRLRVLALLALPGLGGALAFYLLPTNSALFVPAWFLGQMFLMGWFGALAASLDELAPPGLRASVLGFGLLTLNLVGVALGPWVTGLIGDRASLGTGLLLSLAVGAAGTVILAATDRALARAAERPGAGA